MHTRRRIVCLCLLALVWCQTAMAARLCHGGVPDAQGAQVADCHARGDDASEIRTGELTECPATDIAPDLGKLPPISPLPSGHDYFLLAPAITAVVGTPSARCAREGPELAALCRLLI